MPLRDHFHAPLDDFTSWDGFHGGWPMVIVQHLGKILPPPYVAAPRVHPGSPGEIDVSAYDTEPTTSVEAGVDGGVATATWAPSQPTLVVETELPDMDEYGVRVYDTK